MKFRHLLLLCELILLLNTSSCRAASMQDVALSAVSRVIRWHAFWAGAENFGPEYIPGRVLEMRLIQLPNKLIAILGPIQFILEIGIESGSNPVQTLRLFSYGRTTNAESAKWILSLQGKGDFSCIGSDNQGLSNPLQKSTLPIARPCPVPVPTVVSDTTVSFTLPELTAPDEVQKKVVPQDNFALLVAVRQYLDLTSKACGERNAKIPFYSENDPAVYVLISQRRDCLRGVAEFVRGADSKWEIAHFFGDIPKEGLFGLISKIESNTGITVP